MKKLASIKKAIIPVAGYGTRMLPATKAIPKEMLPIFDKPVIQLIVEEAVEAGIEEIIFVTRSGKEAIENHFDINFELENKLKSSGDRFLLKSLKNTIPKNIKFSSVRQEKALGLGHAILCAKHLLNEEPFAILLPDEILVRNNRPPDFSIMVKKYKETGLGNILVEKISKKRVSEYGIADITNKKNPNSQFSKIKKLVEKPKQNNSPSNFRIIGRYVLPFNVISNLSKQKKDKNGEIQLTNALDEFIKENPDSLYAYFSSSDIYDCGSKKGYIGANIALASMDKSIKRYLKEILLN